MIRDLTALVVVSLVAVVVVWFAAERLKKGALRLLPSGDKFAADLRSIRSGGADALRSIFKPGPADAGYINQTQARAAAAAALAARKRIQK